jgi:leucyl/phenylalanyl-tRNA--protein transferase
LGLPIRDWRSTTDDFVMLPSSLLITAYASGWFPMATEGVIRWYSPDPRGILPLDAVHIPKRLARVARQGRFRIEIDRAFGDVIRACAADDRDPDDPGTWINDEIIESYTVLHDRGVAHSVEAWLDDRLVGGLYGVAIRGAFFGESMFHRVTDASKVAVVALVELMRAGGGTLLDVQWTTPHLASLGAIDVPRARYLELVADAVQAPTMTTFPHPRGR